MIVAGLSSIPARIYALKDTIDSLYDQVDVIKVYLNGYGRPPLFLKRDKIKVFRSSLTGDLGDLGKYHEPEGIYFSCDDDLIYPPDYVNNTLKYLKKYKCIVSYHGKIFKSPITKFYVEGKGYHCLHNVDKDVEVHIPGTGVAAFDTKIFKFTSDEFDFQYRNMSDIHIGVMAKHKGVKVMCLKHKEGWIKHSNKVDLTKTIHAKYRHNDSLQVKLMNTQEWT